LGIFKVEIILVPKKGCFWLKNANFGHFPEIVNAAFCITVHSSAPAREKVPVGQSDVHEVRCVQKLWSGYKIWSFLRFFGGEGSEPGFDPFALRTSKNPVFE
jgi:hypothetical protein